MNSKLPDTARSLQALLTSHFCGLGLCCRSFPPWHLYPWHLLPQQPLPLWPLCICSASACVPGFSLFPLLLSLHTFTLGDLAYTNKGKSFLLLYYTETSKDLKVECSFPQNLSYKKAVNWVEWWWEIKWDEAGKVTTGSGNIEATESLTRARSVE